eukprot:GHVO01000023.1.p1 GENE.GHVO01000023.1~~GHVO01000023.1.p1  ORF type:complete len:308 (+),score=46.88 GHVO01000023.1:316-1239(+)
MSENLDDILRYKEAVADTTASADDILEVLGLLDGISVDRSVLSSTKIGIAVGKLRKHNDNRVAKQSRTLVDKWKDFVGHAAEKQKVSGSEAAPKSDSPVPASAEVPNMWQEEPSGADQKETDFETLEFQGPLTSDPRRNKAREVLFRSFITGVPKEQQSSMHAVEIERIAASIEDALNDVHVDKAGSLKEYGNQLRAIKSNLGDKKNSELNVRIYMGAIQAESLATMTSVEMASDAKKRQRQKAKKNAIEACQSDWDLRNIKRAAGQFPCGKCKSQNTVYFQMQTRSADEPMTTYVNCLECGNRWKF